MRRSLLSQSYSRWPPVVSEFTNYSRRENRVAHFSEIKLARLTNSGNVIDATISPDGKYIVYVLSDRSSHSLWIRQVSTANDKLIVQPAPRWLLRSDLFTGWQRPLLRQSKQISIPARFIAFPRSAALPSSCWKRLMGQSVFLLTVNSSRLYGQTIQQPGNSSLVIANSDGTGERDLAVKNFPQRFSPIFFTGPSWSPDGKTIATSVATLGEPAKSWVFRSRMARNKTSRNSHGNSRHVWSGCRT